MSPAVNSRTGKFIYLPFLVLLLLSSIATMGVCGALLNYFRVNFNKNFPTEDLNSRTILLTFASVYTTIAAGALLIGHFVAPRVFSLFRSFAAMFLGFLLFIVGAPSMTQRMVNYRPCTNNPIEKCTLFLGLEGIAWVACCSVFICLLSVGYMWLSEEVDEQNAQALEDKKNGV